MKFFDDQKKFIQDIREAARKFDRVLCVLPTGGGKTVVFTWIAAEALKKGKRVYILGHRREIIKQIYRALDSHGLNRNLIGFCLSGIKEDRSKPLQIMGVDTVIRRLDKYDTPDLLIIDEAHHIKAKSWDRIFGKFGIKKALGFTATPIRFDNKPLKDRFQTMVLGLNLQELIAKKRLSKYKAFGAKITIDTVGLQKAGNDFNKKAVSNRADKPVLIGDAVSNYKKFASGKTGIAFCTSIKHAEHIAEAFNQSGIEAKVMSAKTQNRQELIDKLAEGVIKILAVCDIVSEGTDIPSVDCAILLRPTLSLGLYLQQVGRVLRVAEGKTEAIIIDHAGNIQRHGFPDDIREWSLEEGVKRREKVEISIRTCDKCLYCYDSRLKACPNCQGVNEVLKQREIEIIEGELEELKRIEKKREVGKARTLEQLKEIERVRGYKKGWAEHVFRNRKKK